MAKKQGRTRGLPTLNEARAVRTRQVTTGKARMPATPPWFWLWTAVVFTGFGVIYWIVSSRNLASARSELLSKQRAVKVTLGAKLLPFRDRVEKWAQELATGDSKTVVADDIDLQAVMKGPAIYLRLRQETAKDPKALREHASRSLRDGFTSCFFKQKAGVDPRQGKSCFSQADCEVGYLCNEWDVCTRPVQPYNLRLAFAALRTLSPEWTSEVHNAETELGLAGYERDLERATKGDIPIAIEVLHRAKYLTIVLDEEPKGGLPEPLEGADAAPGSRKESDEERIQRVAHWARIGVWELATGKQIVRYRGRAQGELVSMGGNSRASGAENRAAQARQANSCALALDLKTEVGKTLAERAAPAAVDAGASDAGASDAQ